MKHESGTSDIRSSTLRESTALEPNAEDERVALQVIQQEQPDIIVQVADAKNLRRALLLLTQLSEFKIPIVLVLNMMDECKEKGIHIESSILSLKLGVPVVETIATTGQGLEELRHQLDSTRHLSVRGQKFNSLGRGRYGRSALGTRIAFQ